MNHPKFIRSIFTCLLAAAAVFFAAFANPSFAQGAAAVKLTAIGEKQADPSPAETRSIDITLKDLTIQKKYKAKIRVFVNGGDIAELAASDLLPGQNKFTLRFHLKNDKYYGIGEVVIDSLGAFPLILNGKQNQVELEIARENLSGYLPPSSGPELSALALFLKIYRGYETMIRIHSDRLVSPFGRFSADTAAFSKFLTDYISFRKQFNIFFEYAKHEYPGTFVADHLAGIFIQPEIHSLQEARDLYFSNWYFGDSTLLNTPLFDRQLDLYRFIASFPSVADDDKTTDGLFSFAKKYFWGTRMITDHISEYWITNLFRDNKDGQMDEAISHFYRQWMSSDVEACNEEAGGETVFRNAFIKRLGNISKMKPGMIFPGASGFTTTGKKVNLNEELKKSGLTIFFVWSSTCSHCEEYSPQLEKLAEKYKDKMQVIAYSIDKSGTADKWAAKAEGRKDAGKWTDIAEVSDMSSTGISNLCYMGTPSVFLLDKQGKILSKDHNLSALEKLINQ